MVEREKLILKEKAIIIVKYFLIFLPIPIIGTLLHEVGHYLVAISFGYPAEIHYAYCSYNCGQDCDSINTIYMTWGGPIATWLQSSIPFLILVTYYKKEKRSKFVKDLPPLFITLLCFASFCARFIFNAVGGIFRGFQGDEGRLSRFYGLFPGTIILIFASLAVILLLYLLYMIPNNMRIYILLGAISGAVLGYYLWYYLLGAALLP